MVTAKDIVKGIEKNLYMEEFIKKTVTGRNILASRRLNEKVKTELGTEYVPSEMVVSHFKKKIAK